MPCTDPIGVFDSGLGGISVLRALRLSAAPDTPQTHRGLLLQLRQPLRRE